MTDAAIYFQPDGYVPERSQLGGRQIAGQGFLDAFLRTHRGKTIDCYAEQPAWFDGFVALAAAARGDTAPVRRIGDVRDPALARAGTLYIPGPSRMAPMAWRRRRIGACAFSICGVAHSISSARIYDALGEFLVAPLAPWDALVCPSRALRDTVAGILDRQEAYLRERLGARGPVPRPDLPVIPLGVDTAARDPRRARAAQARRDWRARLGIAEDAVALLFVGRLSLHEKANPLPLFLALRAARRAVTTPLHLILAGWFPNPEVEAAFRDAAAQLCPEVSLHVVDARDADTGSAIWFAGDVFCSLSDTIQETFGLTPVEAMASGLPAIVTDWNGYRDTIEPGITGFLIPTRTPLAGAGAVIAEAAEDGRLSEDTVHGFTSLLTAFDIGACAQAIVRLAGDAALRRSMAAAALARAPTYDWTAVLAAYRDLWTTLAARRAGTAGSQSTEAWGPASHPLRQDPFRIFASYPSARLGPGTWLALSETWHEDRARLASLRGAMFLAPLVSFDATAESILAALAAGPMTAGTLATATHTSNPAHFYRSLGWLTKLGLVVASDPAPAQPAPGPPEPGE
jgi:glycosyltransferase involved in cell wall biosynthesis